MTMPKARAPTLPDVTANRRHIRYLDSFSLWRLALSISERLGMYICDKQRLLRRLRHGLVTIYRGRDYTLWVDRYYIAVAPFCSDQVSYLYLTRRHIREEMTCSKALRKSGGGAVLDSLALGQFIAARQTMDCTWKDYAVRQSVLDDLTADIPLDLKASWT